MKGALVIVSIFLIYCRDISAGFLECSTNTDCVAVNAECKNNICECPVGQVFSSDGKSCLPVAVGIKAECIDDQQCAWLLGKYRCYREACSCEKGWRYFEGRCIKSAVLSEPCNTDLDCFNGYDLLAMTCQNEVCSCSEGYYLRGDYDCRPKAETCDYCSLDSDCKTEGNVCKASLCMDSVEGKQCDKRNEANTSFPLSTEFQQGNGEPCETAPCQLPNSICYALTKTCICKRGYFFDSERNECIAELGVDIQCTTHEDCKITSGQCISGRCYCRKTYFTAETNSACQKPMTHDNLFCNNVERCYVLGKEAICQDNACKCPSHTEMDQDYICRVTDPNPPEDNCLINEELCESIVNSVCDDGNCVCPKNYTLAENICLPNLGASCDDNTKQCQIENSKCTNEICTCEDDYIQNGTTTCLKLAVGLNDTCEINEQCTGVVLNSECNENVCQCIHEHISKDGICYQKKYMGDTCTNLQQCHIMLGGNAQCRNSICQCSADMKPTEDMKDCEASGSVSLLHFDVNIMLLFIIFCFQLLI